MLKQRKSCKEQLTPFTLRKMITTLGALALVWVLFAGQLIGYNNKVEMFPSKLIAGMFNFKKRDFFQAAESERKNVKVVF